MLRKEKIRIIQLGLFIIGIILFIVMFTNTEKNSQIEIISKKTRRGEKTVGCH